MRAFARAVGLACDPDEAGNYREIGNKD